MCYRSGLRCSDANTIRGDVTKPKPKPKSIRLPTTKERWPDSLSRIPNLRNNRPSLCPPIFIIASPPLIENVHDPLYEFLFLAGLGHVQATFLVESSQYLLESFDRVVPDAVPDLLCENKAVFESRFTPNRKIKLQQNAHQNPATGLGWTLIPECLKGQRLRRAGA